MASAQAAPKPSLMAGEPDSDFTIRQIHFSDMAAALRSGMADARACHTYAPMLAIIAPAAAIMLAAVVTAPMLMPFVFPVCAGFSLLGPVATI